MLACYEALRRLGYPPDVIYFGCRNHVVYVQLREGDATIDFDCGEFGIDVVAAEAERQFTRQWRQVMSAVRDGSLDDETFMRIWLESWPYNNAEAFAKSIVDGGIIPPKLRGQCALNAR